MVAAELGAALMAVKYFLRGVNADTTCDLGLDVDMDLNQTQGSDTSPVSDTVGTNSFEDSFSFDVEVSGDGPGTGSVDLSLQIDAAVDLDWRARVQDIDDTGCANTNESIGSIHTDSGAGVFTETFAGDLTWDASSERLRVIIETRRIPLVLHGNKTLSIAVSHADSHFTMNGFAGAGGLAIPKAMHHYKQLMGAN